MDLIEKAGAVLVLVEAGNVLANAATCRLIFWWRVDLILKMFNTDRNQLQL